ncbi:MAG: hypothetical protein ACYDCQ_01955 [Dehalococcoidia bacterium]
MTAAAVSRPHADLETVMTKLVQLEEVLTPPTPEQRQQAQAALEQARRVRDELLAARSGKLFPRAEDDLDELRDLRTEELA